MKNLIKILSVFSILILFFSCSVVTDLLKFLENGTTTPVENKENFMNNLQK